MSEATPPPYDEHNDTAKPQNSAILLPSDREAHLPPSPDISTCDNMTTSFPSNKTKSVPKAYELPNIIIDWDNLKKLIDCNLGLCKVCKSTDRTLVQKMSFCYAVTIGIHYEIYEEIEKQL